MSLIRKGRQLKIAYIVTRADPIGGAQIHVRDLAVAMRDQGHSVVVLVGGSGPFLDDLRAHGLDTVALRHLIVPIRPLQDLRAFRELHAALVATSAPTSSPRTPPRRASSGGCSRG